MGAVLFRPAHNDPLMIAIQIVELKSTNFPSSKTIGGEQD